MTSSSCDSDDLAASGLASLTENDTCSSERAAVEDCAQNVEPYHFEPAASDASSSSLESDAEVEDSAGDERLHNTNW